MPIRFGDFELDEQRFELRRNGTLVNAQPRVLEILLFLVTHRERLVTKDELRANVWKEVTVSGAALRQAIREARAVLGEDPNAPQYIETVRGKGYRFRGKRYDETDSHGQTPPSGRPSVVGRRPFFGRHREIECLHLAATEARAGHGTVVLVHGPPGVGKTRLALGFATHQREAGSEVCWGGCREGQSAPPFWPWPEVLHRYAETRDAAMIGQLARGLEQDLVAVAPELREALGASLASSTNESHERAQAVLDAIGSFLRRAAEYAPLTLVLEDLHLADDAALQLLEHLAGSIADTKLMILGTFRSAEGATRPFLSAVCQGSLPQLQSLPLDGLSLGDVRQWLSAASPNPLTDSFAETLHFSTEGLPLLVEAVVDELPTWSSEMLTAGTHQDPGSRRRVKEILGRRLHQLDDNTLQLLRLAAVCGEEFAIDLLASVTGEQLGTLVSRLEQAQLHGVIKPAVEGSLRFAHALHQELLYNELSQSERRQHHATLARAFADRLPQHPDSIVQTAHHFLEAVPYVELEAAAAYAQKAAEWARAKHAYAHAAEYYQRALEVLDLDTAAPRQYAEILLALGHTQLVAGAIDDASATLDRSFELTRAHGHYDLFCRAILLWLQLRRDTAAIDPTFHARIAEALHHVQTKDDVFAQLQVARAMSGMFTASTSERSAWIAEALALTRATSDLSARMEVLRGAQRSHIRFGDGITELGVAEEMLQLALTLRSLECEVEARQFRASALLELGRGADYAHEVATCRERAAAVNTPQFVWMAGILHVGQLFLTGSLTECEHTARKIGKIGEELMSVGGFLSTVTQLFQIGLEADSSDTRRILTEVVVGMEQVLAVAPNLHVLNVVLARAQAHCGHSDPAKEYLARLTDPHFVAPDPLDRNCLTALVCAADLACAQNDVAAATVVSPLLRAWEGWHAVAALGSVYFGPVSYWLGRLSLVRSRREDAQRQFERARRESESAGSVSYRAWADYYLARALPASQGDRSRRLEESARSAAQRFSLGRLKTVLGA